jgi:hypothetical protein
MDTTLENQVIETLVYYPEGSPCATGNCPLPTEQDEVEEEKEIRETILLCKEDLVIFNLRGNVRSGKVISKGKVHLGIDTIGMKSNTKIPATTEFVPMTVFVEKAILDSLKAEVEVEAA